MKFTLAALALIFSSSASAVQLAWDPVYGGSSTSLGAVACSDGSNGLLTKGFTTFGSLPSFPYIGAVDAISGWNDADCGSCWTVTYTNAAGASKSINVLGIDVSGQGFVVSQEAMDDLTGGNAVEFGRVDVTSQRVAPSVCGL